MTDNTPRPSADEIRALVEQLQSSVAAVEAVTTVGAAHEPALRLIRRNMTALCAAVESLLEDRELLDGLERELKVAGSVDFVGVTPGTVRVYTFQRDYEGPTLRDALREAVGA